jgi:DNA-binding XRE family transcriptional regulator
MLRAVRINIELTGSFNNEPPALPAFGACPAFDTTFANTSCFASSHVASFEHFFKERLCCAVSVDAMSKLLDDSVMTRDKTALLTFGKTVRRLRSKMRLSQEQFAHLAEFDRTYVSLVERGKRNVSLTNICRFAKALNTTPSRLLKSV